MMKKTKKIVVCTVSWLLVLFMAAPPWVFAQGQGDTQKFTQAELDQMMAPIALYPDALLAQILMASTYPLEVVMADRWGKEHKGLQGDQLNAELDTQDWDPSVKALVPFPQVLAMMSENLEWTEKLGDAFLDQQDAVMDTVQKLRDKARATGYLKSGTEQKVIMEGGIIVIEPVNPDVIYVPLYNPAIVYGQWWYPGYPPFWYYPPGYVVVGIVFNFPFFCAVGPSWLFAWGNWDWYHHRIFVNVDRHINTNQIHISRTAIRTDTWHHDVTHRRGVLYLHESNRERFGQTSSGSADTRRVFRGFSPEPKTSSEFHGAPQQTVPQNRGPSISKVPEVTPKTVPQNSGISGSKQSMPERSRDKTIFGGMDRGSDVIKQSERGSQSRQSSFPQGGTKVGPHSGGAEGGSHGGSSQGGGRGHDSREGDQR
jgi:hypothetical protein